MEERCIGCGEETDHRVGGPDGTEPVCRKCAPLYRRDGIKNFTKRGCFGRFARKEVDHVHQQ